MPSFEDEIDFSDLEAKYTAIENASYDAYIVVDGIPVVPEAKIETLKTVLNKKVFGTVGKVVDMNMPVENGKTKGFAFIEFENGEQANNAITKFHMKKLDAKHTLLVNKLTDIDYALEDTITYKEPQIEEFKPIEHLRSWLIDGRDQLMMHSGDVVGVFWNKKSDEPEKIIARKNFTEKYAKWSPKGTYLFSLHRQGVQMWGGESFSMLGRFVHSLVLWVDVSPNERFVVTCSEEPLKAPPVDSPARAQWPFKESDEGNNIVVWDLRTCLPLRSFPLLSGSASGPQGGPKQQPAPGKKIVWPILKWSADDKYFARLIPGESINVYESSTLSLLDKKPIKIQGVVDFEWAPALVDTEGRIKGSNGANGKKTAAKDGDHLICYWTPEIDDQTARVSIMNIPTKEVIRSRNLFNVAGCRIHWQSAGNFLCIKVDRFTKTKKSTFTNLEFFRLTEKAIPVDVVELKDTVINFAWEPKSDRFVTISSADPTTPLTKHNLSFYRLEQGKGLVTQWRLTKSFPEKTVNSIYWSPKGRFLITATISNSSASELEFWDMDHEVVPNSNETELQHNGTFENYGMTDLEWDPSGRYVATYSSSWRHSVSNGYKIWDFRGHVLRDQPDEKFKALAWRPRPASILPKDKRKQVNKNLKSYSRRFDEEDAMEASEASRELIMRRRNELAEWREWRRAMEAKLLSLHLPIDSTYPSLLAGDEVIEETREEILEEKIEEVSS